jgi:myo-inositol-1-phosphate synthase
MVWCGSTEAYRAPGEVHSTLAKFEKGLEENHPDIAPSMIFASSIMAGKSAERFGAPLA